MSKHEKNMCFSNSVRGFAAAFGTTPPSEVYSLHPAHEALTDAIKAAVWRKFRGAKSFFESWADNEAAHILRDLVIADGEVTEAGVTADEIREDMAAYGQPLPGATGLNRDLDAIAAALIDPVPPARCPRLLAAWQAVRACPAPDMNLIKARGGAQ